MPAGIKVVWPFPKRLRAALGFATTSTNHRGFNHAVPARIMRDALPPLPDLFGVVKFIQVRACSVCFRAAYASSAIRFPPEFVGYHRQASAGLASLLSAVLPNPRSEIGLWGRQHHAGGAAGFHPSQMWQTVGCHGCTARRQRQLM